MQKRYFRVEFLHPGWSFWLQLVRVVCFSVRGQVEIINNVLLCVCVQEMCEGGRWSADEWLPLQELLLPIILGDR